MAPDDDDSCMGSVGSESRETTSPTKPIHTWEQKGKRGANAKRRNILVLSFLVILSGAEEGGDVKA